MGRSSTTWKKGDRANPNGRPKNKYVQELNDALDEFKKENNESFVEHCLRQAKTEPALANAILKKVMPDLKYVESDVNVSGSINLDHMKDNDLRDRIAELESLGTRGTVRSKKGTATQKLKR